MHGLVACIYVNIYYIISSYPWIQPYLLLGGPGWLECVEGHFHSQGCPPKWVVYHGKSYEHGWLVGGDWNMTFIFPYIGKNHNPNWLIFFRGVETTNQMKFGVTSILGSLMKAPYVLVWSLLSGMNWDGSITFLPKECDVQHPNYIENATAHVMWKMMDDMPMSYPVLVSRSLLNTAHSSMIYHDLPWFVIKIIFNV